jgi:hypothetical protein
MRYVFRHANLTGIKSDLSNLEQGLNRLAEGFQTWANMIGVDNEWRVVSHSVHIVGEDAHLVVLFEIR